MCLKVYFCGKFHLNERNIFMEKKVTWRLVATYKGKDGYGYGTTRTKTVKKKFEDKDLMLNWINKNDRMKDFSGFNVTTILDLSSYKVYKCVESLVNVKSFT